MAKIKEIEIKTGPAIKNIQDLKNNISEYKKQLAGLTIGTNEYQNTLKALQTNQAALRNAMHGTTASMSEVMNAATAANVAFDNQNNLVKAETLSYNELVRKLDILKQQWRATTNAAERLDLGRRIDNVNNRLKQLDSTVGVYGRNVGNYVGALQQFSAGFASMGRGAAAAVNPIRNTTMALKTMSATPAVAVLGLIANLLSSVISNLKTSEENTNALSKAMSIFAGAGDFVTNVMQSLGKALASVVGSFTNLLGNIFPQLQRYAEGRALITEHEIDLVNKRRLYVMKDAEDELRIAKARQEAADKYTLSAAERIEKLEYANYLEKQIAERAKEIATAEYEIQKERAARAGNSAEENNKLAEAYAKMVQADTNYYQTTIRLQSQLSTARKEMADEADAARKKVEEAITAELQALEAIGKEIDATIEADGQALVEAMEQQNERERDALERRMEVIQKGVQTRLTWNEILTEDEREQAKKRYDITLAGNEMIVKALQEAYTTAMQNGDLEAALDYERQIADKRVEIEQDAARRIREEEKATAEATKETMVQRVQSLQDAMNATASIFDSLADIYEGNTKQTKQEAERVKNLRIAGATIDMLNGVVSAISTAQELGPIAGPIMAAINSAAVITAGVANIAKIRNTNVSTSSASTTTPAVTQAPAIEPQLTQVRTLTGATEEDRLNRMADRQRVYILDSDIEAKRDERRVQVEETTF